MPKQRKSAMQLLRLPFKARGKNKHWNCGPPPVYKVQLLSQHPSFGFAWESTSVHDCFGQFKMSPSSFGRHSGALLVFTVRCYCLNLTISCGDTNILHCDVNINFHHAFPPPTRVHWIKK